MSKLTPCSIEDHQSKVGRSNSSLFARSNTERDLYKIDPRRAHCAKSPISARNASQTRRNGFSMRHHYYSRNNFLGNSWKMTFSGKQSNRSLFLVFIGKKIRSSPRDLSTRMRFVLPCRKISSNF